MCKSIPLSKRLKFRTYGKCGGKHYIGEITVKLDEHETMGEIEEMILCGLQALDLIYDHSKGVPSLSVEKFFAMPKELEELKQVMTRNNNTFDSLHKERDALNVRVSRLLQENEKLNSDLSVVNEKLTCAWNSNGEYKKLYENAISEGSKLKAENEKLKRDNVDLLKQHNDQLEAKLQLKQELAKEKEEHRIWYEEVDKLSDVLFMIKFEMEGFERQGKKQEFFNQFYTAISELVKNERLSVSTYQKLQHENKELSQQLECYKEHDSTLEKLISTHTLISLTDLEKHDKLVKGLEHIVAGMAYAEARKEFHTIGYWRTQILSLFIEVIKS